MFKKLFKKSEKVQNVTQNLLERIGEVRWTSPERFEVEPHWLNKEENYYMYCQFAEAEEFQQWFRPDPYVSISLYLIKILPGYGYKKEKYAVLKEWKQEGHPSYSDCVEHTLEEFNTLTDAVRRFKEREKELMEQYPD